MELVRDPRVLERMDLAFDLYEAAEEMMRQNLRRRNPEATEAEIEAGIREWLGRQPEDRRDGGSGGLDRRSKEEECSASEQR